MSLLADFFSSIVWLLRSRGSVRRAEPITPAGRSWLVAGYLATVAFYIAVATHYLV